MQAVNYFLPAKSRVAILGTKPGAQPSWYTTKKSIPLPDPDKAKMVDCPMRGRIQQVEQIAYEGFLVHFLPGQRRVDVPQEDAERALGLQMYALEYDIPERVARQLGNVSSGGGHPADYLWNYGCRSSKSCWIIPKGLIPWSRLDRLTEVGATWQIKKIDPTEAAATLDNIIQNLNREVVAVVEGARETQRSATERLEATPAEDDPSKAQRAYLSRVKGLQKRIDDRLKMMAAGAQIFGIDLRMLKADAARSTVSMIAASMQERARQFRRATETAREISAEGAALANATEANEMPPEILADFLQEQGHDEQAEALRAAFIAPAEPAAVVPPAEDADEGDDQPPADGDGVFSLVGADDAA